MLSHHGGGIEVEALGEMMIGLLAAVLSLLTARSCREEALLVSPLLMLMLIDRNARLVMIYRLDLFILFLMKIQYDQTQFEVMYQPHR